MILFIFYEIFDFSIVGESYRKFENSEEIKENIGEIRGRQVSGKSLREWGKFRGGSGSRDERNSLERSFRPE